MFNKSTDNNDATFFSESCHLEGNIQGTENIEIAGLIDGNITTKKIIILDTGSVKGDIKGASIEVDGQINGNLEANNIFLGKNAVVRGNISFFETLKTEEGADVDGYIKKNKQSANESTSEDNVTEKKYQKPVLIKGLKKEAV
tara:strand:- start:228 stop:656 length:429 start_codon:yes stop_codon:yes gene_type:complete